MKLDFLPTWNHLGGSLVLLAYINDIHGLRPNTSTGYVPQTPTIII